MPKQDKTVTTPVQFELDSNIVELLSRLDQDSPENASFFDEQLRLIEANVFDHALSTYRQDLLHEILALLPSVGFFDVSAGLKREGAIAVWSPADAENELLQVPLFQKNPLSEQKDVTRLAKQLATRGDSLKKRVLTNTRKTLKSLKGRLDELTDIVEKDVRSNISFLKDEIPLVEMLPAPEVKVAYSLDCTYFGSPRLDISFFLYIEGLDESDGRPYLRFVTGNLCEKDLNDPSNRLTLSTQIGVAYRNLLSYFYQREVFEHACEVRISPECPRWYTGILDLSQKPFYQLTDKPTLVVHGTLDPAQFLGDIDYIRMLQDLRKRPLPVKKQLYAFNFAPPAVEMQSEDLSSKGYDIENAYVSPRITFDQYLELAKHLTREHRKLKKAEKEQRLEQDELRVEALRS